MATLEYYDILLKPVITEKSMELMAEKNLLLVKGAIPGPKKGLVTIKETTKADA